MNIKYLQDNNLIVFEAISGSKSYGTNIPGSDTDIRGIFIQPTNQILMGEYVPQVNDDTNDTVYYEIQRFIELLSVGNPNMLELLNVPEDCILIKKDVMNYILDIKDMFITSKLRNTFLGYAQTQVKKSIGLDKKIFNPQPKDRKNLLDFCYIIKDAKSIPFWEWMIHDYYPLTPNDIFEQCLSKWGVSKVQNGTQLFAVYVDYGENNFRGMVKDLTTTDLRMSSIPKEVAEKNDSFLIYYNNDGFKKHCSDHKKYWDWVEKRNEQRYEDNLKGDRTYDKKNALHTIRLLNVYLDILKHKQIIVRRPEAKDLIEIRNGRYSHTEFIELVDSKTKEINALNETITFPDNVNTNVLKDILLKIRHYHMTLSSSENDLDNFLVNY